jgi:PAS domain S-box-containing protein
MKTGSQVDNQVLTGVERFFDPDEVIVTKTDPKGLITYANSLFLKVAGFREQDVLGVPHSIIRHPDMPACVFKLLWDIIGNGQEIFAYVNNRASNGDHYWVFAHVTPSFNEAGTIVGYHSNRRVPRRDAVGQISQIYALLLAEERRHGSRREAMQASTNLLLSLLEKNGTSYDRFVLSL